ncbi:addiction module protein [Leptolyngbya sp. NIES-2104]|uniref:addiction module protein n=1 Tax=Leptolyngbya sp. NIES-2104 TaxID=1552121 RepID=UPI0006EC7178|nr:addiction module protein [Leptolyngbya sp. NIES-2104]GAP97038.1 hypothetical protein NIES2104_35850 [Leptolyngbya sp. NIES-2104]
MLNTFEDIIRAALTLPANSRAMLAEHLLRSLDAQEQSETDAAWSEVVEQRIEAVKSGEVTPIPATQVLQELRNRNI